MAREKINRQRDERVENESERTKKTQHAFNADWRMLLLLRLSERRTKREKEEKNQNTHVVWVSLVRRIIDLIGDSPTVSEEMK